MNELFALSIAVTQQFPLASLLLVLLGVFWTTIGVVVAIISDKWLPVQVSAWIDSLSVFWSLCLVVLMMLGGPLLLAALVPLWWSSPKRPDLFVVQR